VLPPTVLGFYLLLVLGAEGPLGRMCLALGFEVPAFSFSGLWLASLVASLPFAVQPLHTAFAGIGRRPWEAAATLRASRVDAFFRVIAPLAKSGYLAAGVLSFAHTLGEFGVVLMVGGNIRGRTQTVSTAMYGHVEAMQYGSAHALSLLLLILGFAVIGVLQYSNARRPAGKS
jgi:molybdate transport system permease protein